MKSIETFQRPATGAGRIYPAYDSDADILAVGSVPVRDAPFGVDIDGNLVFDLDRDRIVTNFDLHIGRKLWRAHLDPWPDISGRADLGFTERTIQRKSFRIPLSVEFDEKTKIVRISLGNSDIEKVVALSDRCLALLTGPDLSGFLVKL